MMFSRTWRWIGGVILLFVVTVAVIWYILGQSRMPVNSADRNGMYTAPPAMRIDSNKTYVATISTAKGDIVVQLDAGAAPQTVNNFVFLARQGFYDGLTFHRVIPGFMAQGGDPTGTGRGGPGYQFDQEITEHKHLDGTLSMANAGPNTNGSQFFICYGPQPHLDGGYNIFGQVTGGMDVLGKIKPRDPQRATEPGTKLVSVKIIEE
jgi:cyclophilin family peptidyl-prolyl cis-trans isomerase